MRTLLICLVGGCAAVHTPEPLEPDLTVGRSWEDAVVYGAVPFFFEGAGFDGVTDRVDEIAALGADVIWLSPVAACTDDDFGYAITDHQALRETFGSEEDLRELVAAAHARGLAVILDLAINHTSDQHPWHVSVQHDPASPYASYYDRDEADRITHYFDWDNLPNLNYDEPAVREEMLDALSYWVDTYDVDGFRLDAAWGVQRRAGDFFPEARRRLGPEVLLIAEAPVRDDVWAEQGASAAYDWTDELGVWAWGEAFADPEHTASKLREVIEVDTDVPVFRFLDNNDTGERFATRHGPEATRTAVALLMTLPGIPLVYTGSEVGAALDVYQEGPPLDWADPHGLTATWTEWIALRDGHPALRSRDLEWLDTADPVLAYWRRGGGEELLVGLDFSDHAAELPAQPVDLVDLRDGTRFPAGSPIPIPPRGARLLAPVATGS